jgi:hypothetical protein
MKLICIYEVTDILDFGNGKPELTYGKEYEIIREFKRLEDGRQFVGIRNDSNVITEYLISRFVTKDEFRKKQLEKIGI